MAHLPPKGARVNRALKRPDLWIGDSPMPSLALGPLRLLYGSDGIRQLILKVSRRFAARPVFLIRRANPSTRSFIIVCHSLGS